MLISFKVWMKVTTCLNLTHYPLPRCLSLNMKLHNSLKYFKHIFFLSVMKALQSKYNSFVRTKNIPLSLNIYLDPENVLRIRGRISKVDITYNQQHPHVLPSIYQFKTIVEKSFYSCGVDQAGSYFVKTGNVPNKSTILEYYCIFV